MFDTDTGEICRFKMKYIEPITNVEGTTNSNDNSHNNDNQILFTAAAQNTDKHTQEKRRETSPESSTSVWWNFSSSERSVREGNSTISHRF